MKAPLTPQMFCYDEPAKQLHQLAVKRFFRAALKQLPEFVQVSPLHFNPGGIAVWGEVYCKLARNGGGPAIEAYNTTAGILVRQWNGRDSGRNRYAATLAEFVLIVRAESAQPFRRF